MERVQYMKKCFEMVLNIENSWSERPLAGSEKPSRIGPKRELMMMTARSFEFSILNGMESTMDFEFLMAQQQSK